MAYVATGFWTAHQIGTVDGTAGSMRAKHCYVTNDDAATVETAGYFNALAGRLKVGDQIDCSLDIDGTPALRSYIVSSNDGSVVGITISAASTAA